MKEYTFSYRHGDKTWSLNYFADDLDDAQRKLQSIKANATFEGELVVSVLCPTFIQKVLKWLEK